MKISTRRYALAAALAVDLAVGLLAAGAARAQKDHVTPSKWWPQLRKIDEALRQQKWKPGLKKARRLAQEVTRTSWYGRELGPVLAELALYQAVAEANLGERAEAIWHWHVASNLDFKIRLRDLAPYGSAAKLLLEFPLREEGEVPAGFDVRRPLPGQSFEWPAMPETPTTPEILNNTGAAQEGSGDFKAELLIDEQGRIHQPVVLSPHLNPVVIYSSLEYLPRMPPFEPARIDGEPTDRLIHFTMRYRVVRW